MTTLAPTYTHTPCSTDEMSRAGQQRCSHSAGFAGSTQSTQPAHLGPMEGSVLYWGSELLRPLHRWEYSTYWGYLWFSDSMMGILIKAIPFNSITKATGQYTTAPALPQSQHPMACTDCEWALFVALGHAGITILGSLVRLLYPLNMKEREFFWLGKQLSRLFGFCLLVSITTRKQWLLPGYTSPVTSAWRTPKLSVVSPIHFLYLSTFYLSNTSLEETVLNTRVSNHHTSTSGKALPLFTLSSYTLNRKVVLTR